MTDEELRAAIEIDAWQTTAGGYVGRLQISKAEWRRAGHFLVKTFGIYKGWSIEMTIPPAAVEEIAARVRRAVAAEEAARAERHEKAVRALIEKAGTMVLRAEKISEAIGDNFGVVEMKREAREAETAIEALGYRVERDAPDEAETEAAPAEEART